MGGADATPHKRSRQCRIEPLISTRREDGLWQSIERDEEELATHCENNAVSHTSRVSIVIKEDSISATDMTQHVDPLDRDIATERGMERTPGALSTSETKLVKTETPSANNRRPKSTGDDLPASVPDESSSNPDPATPRAVRPAPNIPHAEPSTPTRHQPATRRRRGRPKKSRNAPNWNRTRRVRFSDPIPPDSDPQPESRDTHVFVRLLKIIVTVESPAPAQQQELVWNNRAKGWRLAGERSERNIGDIADLFDDPSRHGSLLRVVLTPTVRGGAREPVEVGWNAVRCCFQGVSPDLGCLSIALGEMKDMVKDPWARQFVGYLLM